jgi:Fe-S-cluster containining protein
LKRSLTILDDRIQTRCDAAREAHPWWPCAEGCDECCRSLPHLPEISAAEWERLAPAIDALPADVRADVIARTLEAGATPVTCPLLDRERGRCRVYDARPIACRTYGFYTERDAGLHCAKVTRAVAAASEDVVWGNGEAVASDLRAFGEKVSLREWLSVSAASEAPSRPSRPA